MKNLISVPSPLSVTLRAQAVARHPTAAAAAVGGLRELRHACLNHYLRPPRCRFPISAHCEQMTHARTPRRAKVGGRCQAVAVLVHVCESACWPVAGRPAACSLLLAPSPSSRFLWRLPPVGPPTLPRARHCFLAWPSCRSSATLPFPVPDLPRPLFARQPPVLPDPGSSGRGRMRRSAGVRAPA